MFNSFNLLLQVEFFAGSTSSAQGADSPVSDVPDSPVFGGNNIKVNPPGTYLLSSLLQRVCISGKS